LDIWFFKKSKLTHEVRHYEVFTHEVLNDKVCNYEFSNYNICHYEILYYKVQNRLVLTCQVLNCQVRTCKDCKYEVCIYMLVNYCYGQDFCLQQNTDGRPIIFCASNPDDEWLAVRIIRKTSGLADRGLRFWCSGLEGSGLKNTSGSPPLCSCTSRQESLIIFVKDERSKAPYSIWCIFHQVFRNWKPFSQSFHISCTVSTN